MTKWRLKDLIKPTKESNGIDEIMEVFFSNPHNRLIMAMFGVHDKEMTMEQALEFAKTGSISTKGNDGLK